MGTVLHLCVHDLDEETAAAFALVGKTPIDRLKRRQSSDLSLDERRAALADVDHVVVGDARYAFARELPNALGARPTTVDGRTIAAVRELARSVAFRTDDEAHVEPDPAAVLTFLEKHHGDEVFTVGLGSTLQE